MNDIPQEYLTTPIGEWQLNLVTVYVIAHLLGHVYSAVRNSGGLLSIIRSIWLGSSAIKTYDKDQKTSGGIPGSPGGVLTDNSPANPSDAGGPGMHD